jgi:hypothetical protein
MKLRLPDISSVYTTNTKFESTFSGCEKYNDITLKTEFNEGALDLFVTAETSPLTYVKLRFNFKDEEKRKDDFKILGDTYERGYGDLRWAGILPERIMTWYMLVSNGSDRNLNTNGRFTEGFQVRTYDGNWNGGHKRVPIYSKVQCQWRHRDNGESVIYLRNGEGIDG